MAGKTNCKVTKEEFLEVLVANNGNAYKTYTDMGVPYSLYLRWREDPEFEEALQKSRKRGIEFAENKLFDLIEAGNERMIRFLLASKGGYSEKKEVTLNSTNTVDINTALDEIKKDLETE
jgi:hypothetical protein